MNDTDFNLNKTFEENSNINLTNKTFQEHSDLNLTNKILEENSPNILFAFIMGLTCICILVFNSITLLVFRRKRTLRSSAGCIIVNLALCDLTIGVLITVFVVPTIFLDEYPYHLSFIQVEGTLIMIFFNEAIYGLSLAAMDRYVAICWPYKYVGIFQKNNLIAMFVATWMFALFNACIYFPAAGSYIFTKSTYLVTPDASKSIGYTVYLTLSNVGVGFGTMIFSYVNIWLEGRRNIRGLTVWSQPPNYSRQIKLASTLFILTVVYVVNYMGFVVVEVFSMMEINIPPVVRHAVFFFAASNSLYNFFVYTWTYKPFRHALVQTFCKNWDSSNKIEIRVSPTFS